MDAPFEGREVVTDTYVSDGDGRYTPGRLDAVAYAYFTEGWCWALAVVLADRYGWPVWGLGELEDWEHVVAAPAPGMFVDISGMHRERLDGWGEPFLMRSAHLLTIATDSLTEPAEALRAAASMAGPVFDLVVAEMLAV